MYFDTQNSAASLKLGYSEYIKLTADNMIKTRPKKEVIYRPFLAQKGVRNLKALSFDRIDLSEYYPDAAEGDYVYLRVGMTSEHTQKIAATVSGNVELFYGGQSALLMTVDVPDRSNYKYTVLTLEAGINELVIKCTCHNGNFIFYFLTALEMFKIMKARDYLFHTRTVIPQGEYKNEDGYEISRLYHKGERPETIEYIFPAATKNSNKIDFSTLNSRDNFGCALTYAVSEGTVSLEDLYSASVYVNKKHIKSGDKLTLNVCKGDEILVMCRKKCGFGFSCRAGCIGIPFLETERKNGIDWLLITLPEKIEIINDISFKKPILDDGWKRFWRFADTSYLRAYLETSFFGQWFYALMVGNYGLLNAARVTGQKEYEKYFIDNMKIMIEYYDYALYDTEISGEPPFLQRCVELDNLDAIGTMGMNFIEYYNITGDVGALKVINELADAMMTRIPRFEDGAFRRERTMWADDFFMSCPFLVRLGILTGDEKYFDELKTQLMGFKKRLYMSDIKLFSHIYFPDTGLMNRVPWGRGNGWIMLALSEILMLLDSRRKDYALFCDFFAEFAEGIAALQTKNGMWRQVLNNEEAYYETSATAMFVLAFSRGIRLGILPENRYISIVQRGIDGLLCNAVDREGNVYGVCRGSECSMNEKYYMKLETAFNDDHGTGIILCALSEFVKIIK